MLTKTLKRKFKIKKIVIKKKKRCFNLFGFSRSIYFSWYPPGHGDFYDTFHSSGLLKKFIDEGREYCFLSNIDNLGATVDLNILNKLVGEERLDKPIEFVMEVTDKTRADVKVSY